MKVKANLSILWAMPLQALLLCVSCDKMPMNGDLDGMWQLMTEQTEQTTVSRKSDRMYISFQLHTAQFDGHGSSRQYYSTFTHHGDSLRFVTICRASQNETADDDNIPLTADDISLMNDWGIYEPDPAFRVLTLDESTLVLRSRFSTLRFRKF